MQITLFVKTIFLSFFLAFLFFIPNASQANIEATKIYILSSPTCPHCLEAKSFFNELKNDERVNFEVEDYDISRNVSRAQELYRDYQVPSGQQGLVPAIFIDDQFFIGFNDNTKEDITAYLVEQKTERSSLTKIPFLGNVDLKSLSLPVLAITLGIVDGFNVCSLGALIIILGLVMVLGSRRRIILLGGAFIFTTAIIYGLMIFVWHQFFSFIAPYIRSLEMLIGILAIAGGIYLLREFYKAYKSGPVCSSNNLMSRLTPKVEKIFQNKTNWIVLLGAVIIFATIVTVVEFPCSAFLPVLFTGILVESGVSLNASIGYIGLYMLFYLLDEIIIFLIAVATMKIKIVSPKFIIFFNLLAALIFLSLGAYYLLGASILS